MARLYRSEGRFAEARELALRAVDVAELANARSVIHRWQTLLGSILFEYGDRDGAVASTRKAIDLLASIRDTTRLSFGSQSIYERQVESIYDALIAQLLASTGDEVSDEERTIRFLEVLEVLEAKRDSEFRDYYRDPCIATKRGSFLIERLEEGVAVLTPIVLPNGVELLLRLPDGSIDRFSSPIDRAEFLGAVKAFRRDLVSFGRLYERSGRLLYDALIAPVADELDSFGITTLHVAADGPLRTIPFSALFDGERFLVERLAVGNLVSARSAETLVWGRFDDSLVAGLSESREGHSALGHVETELLAVQSAVGGTVQLNRDFTREAIEAVVDRRSPRLLHFATHARFTGDPGTSYLLAHDGPISMPQFDALLRRGRLLEERPEAVVLSACATAEGDHRSVLGLAGVALRVGARRAIGTLWNVGDEATFRLISSLYAQAEEGSSSYAEAIRRSQLDLLRDAEYRHPQHWAGLQLYIRPE